MLSEIRVFTHSVGDLEGALRFYRDGLGYEERGRGAVPAEVAGPWRMPAGVAGETVLLAAPGSDTGMLRLVEYSPPGEHAWGRYERFNDTGLLAANYRVRDHGVALERLAEVGATGPPWQPGPVEPLHWTLVDTEVRDAFFVDSEATAIDVYEIVRGPAILGGLDGEVSPLEAMAIHVVDMKRSRPFYEGLGYRAWLDSTFDAPSFLGLPEGSKHINLNMMMGGDVVPGRVELVECVLPGGEPTGARPIGGRAVPPNRGYLSISLESDGLDADVERMRDLGGSPVDRPVEAELPGLGRCRLAVFLGPDQEAVELYQSF